MKAEELNPLIDNLEAALKSAHAGQVAALEALRKLAKQADYQPGGESWDWELDGSGLEGIPPDIGLLTVQEVAAFLRISQTQVYELVRTRQLPHLRFGNRIRVGRRQLVAYMRGMNADQFDDLIRYKVDQQLQAEERPAKKRPKGDLDVELELPQFR